MLHGTRIAYRYTECSDCGGLQVAAQSAPPHELYPTNYYAHQEAHENTHENTHDCVQNVGPGEVHDSDRDGAAASHHSGGIRSLWTRTRLAGGPALRLLSGQRYDHFRWFTKTHARIDSRILDAGCGSGRLLKRLHRAGFRELVGIDPNLRPSLEEPRAGPRFEKVALEDHRERYDLVMAHHSFEHCEDPRAAFGALAACVEEGGWLLIRVPRADCWAFRRFQESWAQLDAPRHRFIPTVASMRRLADDFDLHLEFIRDDSGPFQIWGSELYRRDIALTELGSTDSERRRALGVVKRMRSRLWSLWLRGRGEGDQAAFYFCRNQNRPPT